MNIIIVEFDEDDQERIAILKGDQNRGDFGSGN